MLEKAYQYYQEHKHELLEQYEGKFVVIKKSSVLGAYNSEEEALTETLKEHELGTFLVKLITAEENNAVLMYTSRVLV